VLPLTPAEPEKQVEHGQPENDQDEVCDSKGKAEHPEVEVTRLMTMISGLASGASKTAKMTRFIAVTPGQARRCATTLNPSSSIGA
jgi:hypothetical protein